MAKKTFYKELVHGGLPVPSEVVKKWAVQSVRVKNPTLGGNLYEAVLLAQKMGLVTNETAATVRIMRGRPTQEDIDRSGIADDLRSWPRRR